MIVLITIVFLLQALQDWPGLPYGVKFDPTDQELIEHLQGKVGFDNYAPHPLIDEFLNATYEKKLEKWNKQRACLPWPKKQQ